jgi:hypothetical protein
MKNRSEIECISFPSLQGTLTKRTKLTLQPIFAKEPFRPSRSNSGLRDSTNLIDKMIENINRQCLTANISKLGVSGLRKACTKLKKKK